MKPVWFFTSIFLSSFALAAPDEEVLGKSRGYPVCVNRDAGGVQLAQHCLVGLLTHYDSLVPSHKVARAPVARQLKRAAAEPAISYQHRDNPPGSIDGFLGKYRNTGLLVLQGDTIQVERYQYERNDAHRFASFSMAKTVVAMLVGIALHEQLISSIDDRADKYVPELKGHPYGETSLRHLLTMSSGVKVTEDYSGKDDHVVLSRKTYGRQGPGGADAVLDFRTREAAPGTRFAYASAETQVLSVALRNAVGRPLAEYLSEKIWQPMGAEADATWLIDGGGYEMGYAGMNATLRDWGRLGLLFANDGAVDGRQVIPAEWVRAMTTAESPHLKVGVATRFNGYGYQTWLIHPSKRYFALLGVRGQAVYVDPETKTVVVHTAVHATQRDPARAEQFSLFYGTVASLKQL